MIGTPPAGRAACCDRGARRATRTPRRASSSTATWSTTPCAWSSPPATRRATAWRTSSRCGVRRQPARPLGLIAPHGRWPCCGPRLRVPQDVFDLAPDVLRHRLVLTYDALADGVQPTSDRPACWSRPAGHRGHLRESASCAGRPPRRPGPGPVGASAVGPAGALARAPGRLAAAGRPPGPGFAGHRARSAAPLRSRATTSPAGPRGHRPHRRAHVRLQVPERPLTTWVVLDLSRRWRSARRPAEVATLPRAWPHRGPRRGAPGRSGGLLPAGVPARRCPRRGGPRRFAALRRSLEMRASGRRRAQPKRRSRRHWRAAPAGPPSRACTVIWDFARRAGGGR